MLNGDGDSPLGLGKDLAPSSVSNPHMKGLRQRLVEQDILLGPPESAHTDTFSTHTHALSHRRAHTHTRKKVMLGLIVSLKPATLDCLKKKMGVERNFLQKHSRQTDPLEPFEDTV